MLNSDLGNTVNMVFSVGLLLIIVGGGMLLDTEDDTQVVIKMFFFTVFGVCFTFTIMQSYSVYGALVSHRSATVFPLSQGRCGGWHAFPKRS